MAALTDAELKSQQRAVIAQTAIALSVGAAVLALGYYLLPRWFVFPTSLAERLAFALQADLFIFLWLVIAAQLVSSGRYRSRADNRGSAYGAPSPAIAVKAAFLQNTLEQAVMTVGAHLIVATLVSGPALALIPTAVLLFAAGRIAFLLGYSNGAGGRAFGMVLTALPMLTGYGFALVVIAGRLVGGT